MQEMIALYHLDMVWQKEQKEEPKKSPGHTTGRVKQQKHHAETRDPPSQDSRNHMAQADRHNNSPIITSKQTTTTPRRNESGEKKGETDSETRANVRRENVKRTVKQPSGCAQSPLSSAFPIIILLGNFLYSALVVLLDTIVAVCGKFQLRKFRLTTTSRVRARRPTLGVRAAPAMPIKLAKTRKQTKLKLSDLTSLNLTFFSQHTKRQVKCPWLCSSHCAVSLALLFCC